MNNEIISLKKISKSYGDKDVLKNIDFSVIRGSVMGLIGKNGAGKTTMIKIMLGLLSETEGESIILGENSWNLSSEAKARIGYVPQNLIGMGWMRVEGLLAYTGAFYKKWNEKKVNKLLKEWELDPWSRVSELSEGEKQKLAIIQAMGHDPELFILDEPVASLDPSARRQFIKQIIEMNINEEKTVLFSTHITSDLERVAADVALLDDGKIKYRGDLSSLKENVYRLRITAKEKLPKKLKIENMLRSSVKDKQAVVTVNGLPNGEVKKYEKQLKADIVVESLNLEEIFLEMVK